MATWAEIAEGANAGDKSNKGGASAPGGEAATQPATPAGQGEEGGAESVAMSDCRFSPDDSLQDAMYKLWTLDTNRLTPGEDYLLDVQGYTHYNGTKDWARRPLFKFVNHDALRRKTYWAFYNLLDNYTREVGIEEKVSMEEKDEIKTFVNSIYDTLVMKYVHQYLTAKGVCPPDAASMKKLLVGLWFRMYNSTKGGPKDSCGFEHVFVGEVKFDSVTGMHNWFQLYKEEKLGRLDYQGYISKSKKADRPAETAQLLTIQFTAAENAEGDEEATKKMSTSFIGVSPEFEIALYTLLALCGEQPYTTEEKGKEVTKVEMADEFEFEIHIVKWGSGFDTKIRTAFPVM